MEYEYHFYGFILWKKLIDINFWNMRLSLSNTVKVKYKNNYNNGHPKKTNMRFYSQTK